MATGAQSARGPSHPALREALANVRTAMKTVLVFSLVINLLMLTQPVYMLQIYDRVLGSGKVETLLMLTLIAAFAILVMSVLDTLRNSVTVRVGCWLNDHLGPVYFESGVSARLKGAGNGAESLRDLSSIQQFIATQGLIAFFDMPWAPIFIAIIWMLHPWLGILALVSAFLLLLASLANDWVTRKPTSIASGIQAQAIRIADSTIRNAESVRAMGFLPAMIDRWRQANSGAIAAIASAYERGGIVMSLTKFIRNFVQVAILGLGAYLVLHNELTAGAMIAASILLGRALAPIEMAIGAWKNLMQARLAYQRLASQLEQYPPAPARMALPIPEGRLEVNDLYFCAPNSGQPILRGVSFSAEPGEAIAVIGPSGAGKSTLCRLLVGLADADGGEVRLDGSEIGNWDSRQLGRHVGFLPQEVELFTGTVRENIARMSYDDSDTVIQAAVTAHAHPLIQRLPEGYDTAIGDGGVRLSGGQRQRVGLARAVYGDPKLIVLDEPNANLDQAGESALAEAIADLKRRGCLLIIVGHRPSTLAQADKVLVLQSGIVTMFGARDAVLEALSGESAGKDAVPMRKPSGPGALRSEGRTTP
jgi:PrtD family type I secretion system ABC transporter